jgi:hypothetical protein
MSYEKELADAIAASLVIRDFPRSENYDENVEKIANMFLLNSNTEYTHVCRAYYNSLLKLMREFIDFYTEHRKFITCRINAALKDRIDIIQEYFEEFILYGYLYNTYLDVNFETLSDGIQQIRKFRYECISPGEVKKNKLG